MAVRWTIPTEHVAGIDVHPVAVIFARATYLLALAATLRQGRPVLFNVPVYLGDALQWNAHEFMNFRDLEIVVPREGEAARTAGDASPKGADEGQVILRFPIKIASDPDLFDPMLDEMLNSAEG
jgi:hypothetical protein